MSTEVALPTAEQATAGVLAETQDTPEVQTPEPVQKKEKTPEQLEIDRRGRRIDRLTRREAEARAELNQLRQQVAYTSPAESGTNTTPDDDKPIPYTRKQIEALITEQARQLAPKIAQVESVEVQRRTTAQRMAQELGADKFEAYTSDLDEAMGGMTDSSGQLKPAIEAIFESETPSGLLEYLADPDNADEAEALGRMSALKAGIAIAKLETKVKALAESRKAKDKPQPSDVPPPIERLKGSGQPASAPQDSDSIDVWLKKERARLEAKRKAR